MFSAYRLTVHRRLLFAFALLGMTLLFAGCSTTPVAVPNQTTIDSEKTTPTTETITETKEIAVPFSSNEQDDPTLLVGQTKVQQEGKDGIKVQIFEITLVDGKETGRALKEEAVSVQPTEKITLKGTKQPEPVAVPQSPVKTYTNSAGNEVQSPTYYNSAPAGATAQCGDGTYSFSQSRRGTCSHHGGVAEWLE